MHYGYRKKRLFSFPLLNHAPFQKCFDCFMLTFIVPIWDKNFKFLEVPSRPRFRDRMRVPSKKLLPKNHASTTRDRLNGFARNFQHGFATEPEGTHITISPWGSIERPIAGGQFLRFPGVPPWETRKFFISDLDASRCIVQFYHPEYTRRVYFLRKPVFGAEKPVFVIRQIASI